MYVPSIYRSPDDEWPREVVRRHPLALLVSNGPVVPVATHVPIVAMPEAPTTGPLAGTVLYGHMNRTNPHWAALTPGTPGRLVFTGPQSYITPAVYRTTPAAPTWNFVAVHLLGTVEGLSGIDATLEVVTRTAEVFERCFGEGWDHTPSLGYFRDIGPGVGAFRFRIELVESMFKLSQEKDDHIRERVIDWLTTSSAGCARDLASLMCDYGTAGADRPVESSPHPGPLAS